jgi:hypothetical protein
MSILSVDEQFGQRSCSVNELYQRTYTRSFIVVTSDPYVGPIAVKGASGIPTIGAHYQNGVAEADPRHEYDFGSFVQGIQVDETPDGAQIEWKVTVQYGPWSPAVFGSNPVEWPLRVTFGGERTEKVIEFDKTGAPIRNSAKDKFGDPVTIDDHITTLLVTRNELVSTFDIELASAFSDSINDATWNGIPARQAKMGIITTSEEKYDSNGFVWYYTVTYPVQVGRVPWKKNLLDQGYGALQQPAPLDPFVYMSIKGPDGQPLTDPRALDGTGKILSPSGSPVTLPFYVYDETDWSVLDIDLSVRLGL